MIEKKSDRLEVANDAYILRNEILEAIHNFSIQYCTAATDSNEWNDLVEPLLSETKRPTNAFILYSNALRRKLKALFPKYTNCEASKFLGAMWKSINKDIKDSYIKQAIECRRLHKLKYPNFEYNIKKETNTGKAISSLQDSPTDSTSIDYNVDLIMCGPNIVDGIQLDGIPDHLYFTDSYFEQLTESHPQSVSNDGWNEVHNLISAFFPTDIDQNLVIDDEFWTSLASEGNTPKLGTTISAMNNYTL
ncbi:high mobility group box domain-containing protein [Mycotypha africana]|uniref:high mobility group box domain-containing protein n=1 Tax=Mycotypha africana TaxID=64632 RepID=UPI0022FFFF58|nr:high mobility group box domain-containing protein [Mycotypha africana]KAI8977491.1 high mobility group box domain-containing protein [Mycotypha africana]